MIRVGLPASPNGPPCPLGSKTDGTGSTLTMHSEGQAFVGIMQSLCRNLYALTFCPSFLQLIQGVGNLSQE